MGRREIPNHSCSLQGETGPAGAPGPMGSRGGPVSDFSSSIILPCLL